MGKSKVVDTQQARLTGLIIGTIIKYGNSQSRGVAVVSRALKRRGYVDRGASYYIWVKNPVTLESKSSKYIVSVRTTGGKNISVFTIERDSSPYAGHDAKWTVTEFKPGEWYFRVVEDLEYVFKWALQVEAIYKRLAKLRAIAQRKELESIDFSSWEV